MQQKTQLKELVDSIFSINPSFANMFGSGLPGMGGTSATTTGSASSATVIVNQLREETAQFAEVVNSPSTDGQVVTAHAEAIEGCLRNLETLGQISDQFCSALLEKLYALADK